MLTLNLATRTRRHTIVPTRNQAGIALVLVLWVVTLLTVIAGSFAFSTRTHTQLSANLLAQARARALADAGVHRGLYLVSRPDTDSERWKAVGRAYPFEIEGNAVTVSIRDETAKIDLNSAQEGLLKGLLLRAGADEDEANRLLDVIIDWRDGDELSRPQGAEREQYLAAGKDYAPPNAPFQTIEELRLVLGMRPEIYRSMLPALTVFSGQTGINSALAARDVLLAIPDVSVEDVDAYLEQRRSRLEQDLDPEPFPAAARFNVSAGSRVYNLRSLARLEDGTTFGREAVASLSPDRHRPVTILNWKEYRPEPGQD